MPAVSKTPTNEKASSSKAIPDSSEMPIAETSAQAAMRRKKRRKQSGDAKRSEFSSSTEFEEPKQKRMKSVDSLKEAQTQTDKRQFPAGKNHDVATQTLRVEIESEVSILDASKSFQSTYRLMPPSRSEMLRSYGLHTTLAPVKSVILTHLKRGNAFVGFSKNSYKCN